MLKVLLLIQLFIISVIAIYSDNQLSNRSESSVNSTRIECNTYVSLDKKQYVIIGKNDATINCYLKSGEQCNFNEHRVRIELIVNDIGYDMGSVNCKKQAYNSLQESCYMRILFGTEDLIEKRINKNDLKIRCKAWYAINDGVVEGISDFSSLKVIKGQSLYESCSELKPCMADRNLTCNANQCSCKSTDGVQYTVVTDDFGIRSCSPKVGHNQECISSDQCEVYNSQCSKTSVGKLCQCQNGYYWDGFLCQYVQRQRDCPSCNCYQNYYNTDWVFYLNLLVFFCGMIGGIFAFKLCSHCMRKDSLLSKTCSKNRLMLPEVKGDNGYSTLNLDPQVLGKQLDDKLESMKNNEYK